MFRIIRPVFDSIRTDFGTKLLLFLAGSDGFWANSEEGKNKRVLPIKTVAFLRGKQPSLTLRNAVLKMKRQELFAEHQRRQP